MNLIKLAADDIITDADFEALASWIATKPRLSQDKLVREFEEAWAAWLGVKHAVFVNSGSSANLLAYAVLVETQRVPKGSLVYAPEVCWPTTVSPALQLGLELHLADADPITWGLATSRLEDLCESGKTPELVVLVDVLGVPSCRDRLLALRDQYGFVLMEDCCGAHGSTFRGKKVGTFGDLSTFSFFVGHHMTTGEGGMVCTNDDQLNRVLRMVRAHGWAADVQPEERASLEYAWDVDAFRSKFTFYHSGYNVRNTEFAAKLGLLQLPRLDGIVAARARNYELYRARMTGYPTPYNEFGVASPIGFAFLTGGKRSRDLISEQLHAAGVEHRPVGGGAMSHQPFVYGTEAAADTAAVKIHNGAVQVPCHHELTPTDIERVVAAVLS